jgi:hypothetical protein
MTPEARAARERKQKIFVLVGGLVLAGMLAFQLPKLLGGSSSPEANTTAPTSVSSGPIAAATTTANAASAAVTGSTTGVSASASVASTPKLSSFSIFQRKDPFVQQVKTDDGLESQASGVTKDAKGGAKTDTPTGTFTTGAKGAASATIVTVNGARQVLEPGMKFPTGDPLFVLVDEKQGAKSVVVGIVGGAYSGGAKSTTLKIGKPLTLVNTTTGARYKISLVSVGNGDQANGAASEK